MTFALAFGLLLLAPLALAGIAIVNAGLGRSRSASQALLGSAACIAIAIISFVLLGSRFAAAAPAATLHAAHAPWDWIGWGSGAIGSFPTLLPMQQCGVLYLALGAAFAALIPWGAGADRLRLAAGCAIAVIFGGFLFPLLAHWIWGGGWLASLGQTFGLGEGFLDPGGAAAIHALGGLCALAAIWTAGARKGKFPQQGLANAMPAHNAVYVLFGCFLALVGWLAWNACGALLWLHADPAALPANALNTLLSASGALMTTLLVTRIRFGKPDASLCANGWLAGLVTSSACAALIGPAASLAAGAVAGLITPLLVEFFELALAIDDPTGAVAVHAAGALWGLFAAGLFAPGPGRILPQLVGIAAILGIFLPLATLLFAGLNRLVPFRVDPEGERLGMDLHELGGSAYPEFVIHRDDPFR